MTAIRFIIFAALAWTLPGSAATALPDTVLQPKAPTAQSVPQPIVQPNPQPGPVSAPPPFLEESALVPVKINGETVRLEMLFVKPQNVTGRLPIILISHGKPATQAEMATVHATNYRSVAHDF